MALKFGQFEYSQVLTFTQFHLYCRSTNVRMNSYFTLSQMSQSVQAPHPTPVQPEPSKNFPVIAYAKMNSQQVLAELLEMKKISITSFRNRKISAPLQS